MEKSKILLSAAIAGLIAAGGIAKATKVFADEGEAKKADKKDGCKGKDKCKEHKGKCKHHKKKGDKDGCKGEKGGCSGEGKKDGDKAAPPADAK